MAKYTIDSDSLRNKIPLRRLGIEVHEKLHMRLKKEAADRGISIRQLVTQILIQFFNK